MKHTPYRKRRHLFFVVIILINQWPLTLEKVQLCWPIFGCNDQVWSNLNKKAEEETFMWFFSFFDLSRLQITFDLLLSIKLLPLPPPPIDVTQDWFQISNGPVRRSLSSIVNGQTHKKTHYHDKSLASLANN